MVPFATGDVVEIALPTYFPASLDAVLGSTRLDPGNVPLVRSPLKEFPVAQVADSVYLVLAVAATVGAVPVHSMVATRALV
jgi:hypothetical protein